MSPKFILMLVFQVGGAVLIGISIPLIQGRVGPNHLYGFRVRRTLEDPNVWYPVNTYSAWRLLVVGAVEIIVATTLYFVPSLDLALYSTIVGGVTIAGLMIGLAQSLCFLHKFTKERESASS